MLAVDFAVVTNAPVSLLTSANLADSGRNFMAYGKLYSCPLNLFHTRLGLCTLGMIQHGLRCGRCLANHHPHTKSQISLVSSKSHMTGLETSGTSVSKIFVVDQLK
jgi:hypothetical protein